MTVDTANDVLPLPHPASAFDAIAPDYDRIFTHSVIGKAQRSLVYEALQAHFGTSQKILDLNCGTGEDALYLASQGMSVVACDISERMIDIARSKTANQESGSLVSFAICANEDLEKLEAFAPFDGVLSNFGGLNCTSDLAGVARTLSTLVRPGGELFLCMLGRFCAWEIMWYSSRAQWGKAFRRMKRGGTEARVAGSTLRVLYPSVRKIRRAFAPTFKLVSWRGVGVTVPPSWMEPVFQHHASFISMLTRVDRRLGAFPVFRGFADHILLHFVREGK